MKAPEPADPEGMNMTPMIDVTFQLIIFFMLVTDMTQRQTERLELPSASKAIEEKFADPTTLIVNIRKDGSVWIDGRKFFTAPPFERSSEYDASKLEELFALRKEDKRYVSGTEVKYPLLIRADRSSQWQWVQMIMQIATVQGGVTRVQMGAVQEEAN